MWMSPHEDSANVTMWLDRPSMQVGWKDGWMDGGPGKKGNGKHSSRPGAVETKEGKERRASPDCESDGSKRDAPKSREISFQGLSPPRFPAPTQSGSSPRTTNIARTSSERGRLARMGNELLHRRSCPRHRHNPIPPTTSSSDSSSNGDDHRHKTHDKVKNKKAARKGQNVACRGSSHRLSLVEG